MILSSININSKVNCLYTNKLYQIKLKKTKKNKKNKKLIKQCLLHSLYS